MFKGLIKQVADAISPAPDKKPDPEVRKGAIQLATAVLMTEVARADDDFTESEFDILLRLIARDFHLSPEAASVLAERAQDTAEEITSLHDFTQLLNDNLNDEEKARVVQMLWRVAFADGQLDKYEDSLVLKISDLLFVSRGRVMGLKHDAEQRSR